MAQLKTPGVYVEERSTLPPSVAEVATAIPVFIGYTEKSTTDFSTDLVQIVKIRSMVEYQTLFGGAYKEDEEAFSVEVTTSAPAAGSAELSEGDYQEAVKDTFKRHQAGDEQDRDGLLEAAFDETEGKLNSLWEAVKSNYILEDDNKRQLLVNAVIAASKEDVLACLGISDDATAFSNVERIVYDMSGEIFNALDTRKKNSQQNTSVETHAQLNVITPMPKFILRQAVELFIANGGGSCYIASAGSFGEKSKKTELSTALHKATEIDEITLICQPDAYSLDSVDSYALQSDALNICAKSGDRFALIDVLESSSEVPVSSRIEEDSKIARDALVGALPFGAAYYPSIQTSFARSYDEELVMVTVDSDEPKTLSSLKRKNTAAYNLAKKSLEKNYLIMPPSAAIAGVMAQVDKNRGVWKAPANVALSRVIKPTKVITNDLQQDLNVDTTGGKSINVIRSFTGKGNLVWGARTLAGNDNEWRYVSVRRFFNMVEESLKKATAFAVFEPNTPFTWLKIKTMAENYLNNLWRQGALFGSTAEQAYFVNVGLGQTMTQQDILEGYLKIEIGLAAVRPAEFIVLTFTHKAFEV